MPTGVYERTEAHKEKMRLGWTEEAREKLRLANLGKKHSGETKEKIRQGNLGKKMSIESREKMRLARLGIKLSDEN